MLFVLTAYLSSSCEKEDISPINQEVAFVKYYGHVGAQTATDVIQTSDGGYILLGSTNSYSTREEMDILVVKTDSLGNEVWSSSFGRSAEGSSGNYLRFSEEGIRIIELPDQSAYVIAANRTYYSYSSASSPANSGVKGKTKVVLYQLDYGTGAPIIAAGTELKDATVFTEEVSDMKIDTAGGVYNYILTGYTTDVQSNKPYGGESPVDDKTDIFTTLLNTQFGIEWHTSALAYGFPKSDYGTSVQILNGGYLICGTSEVKSIAAGQVTILLPRIITVIMEKSGGTPLNVSYFTADGYYFEGGRSVYDADNGVITIAAHVSVTDRTISGEGGKVALLQITETLVPITPNASTQPYCKFYDLQDRNGGGGEHFVASIALLEGNNGFILSSTQRHSDFESDLCVTKFDRDLVIESGWPYFFGYSDENRLILTKDEAGTILPITNTSGSISGYVFTGKFGLGTNEMMGMVKLNTNGTLIP